MDPQNPLNNPEPDANASVLPDPSAMPSGAPKKKSANTLIFIIIGVVGGILAILLIVLILTSNKNAAAKKQALDAQYASGLATGKTEQKAASDKQALIDQSKSVVVYSAPSELGSFQVPIPKLWSFSITPKPADGTFNGLADPQYVDITSELHKFSIDLKKSDYENEVKSLDDEAKKSGGKIVASDATVSGIKGRRYKGVFDDKTGGKAEIVIIPYREKIMLFRTDDPDTYSATFNSLLDGTKLVP